MGCKVEYDYVLEHRPDPNMRHADAFSRNVNLGKTINFITRTQS